MKSLYIIPDVPLKISQLMAIFSFRNDIFTHALLRSTLGDLLFIARIGKSKHLHILEITSRELITFPGLTINSENYHFVNHL